MSTPRRIAIQSIFVPILLFVHAVGAAGGNCHLYYANGTQVTSGWKFGVFIETPVRDDTREGTLVTTLLSENITGVISYESKHLAVSYDAMKTVKVYLKTAINNDSNDHTELVRIYIKFKCRQGNANVYVYVPVQNYRPQFSSSVYSYVLPMPYPPGVTLTSLYGSIYVSLFDFNNTDVEFSIDEAGKRYFNISFASRIGKLCAAAKLLTTSRLHLQEDFVFSITATVTGQLQTTAQVRINVDRANSVPVSPTFQLPVYISTVTDINSAGKFPRDIKLNGTNFADVRLQLKDANGARWDEFFSVSLSDSIVKVSITRKLPENLLNQTVAVIELQAFLTSAEYVGRTVLLITRSNNSIPAISVTAIPETCPTLETAAPKVSLSPSTIDTLSSTTQVRSENLTASLKLTSPTSTSAATKSIIKTTLNSNWQSGSGDTNLFQEMDTYSEIINYATNEKDDHLHFEQAEYNVTAVAKQIGILYQFSAVTSHVDEVVFGIDTDDVRINETFKIGPSSGLLYADEGLTVGEYQFNVTAEVFSTQEHAEAKVNVIVTDRRLSNSLEVYRLLEEYSNGVILEPLSAFNSSLSCKFSVVNQTPQADFFRFNKDKGTLKVVGRIDREDIIFTSMLPPAAITVTLDVTCAPHKSGTTLDTAVNSNNTSRITVKVEIEDVNDNPPMFTVNSLIVGYPAQDAANEILPASITTVKANDKDSEANALIRYSIMPSDYGDQVTIHARTGIVYPTADFRYTDIIFTVLAQDRDAKDGCNNATLHVQLRILQRDEISVVFIENSMTEDVSNRMHQLKDASNYTFYVLDARVVRDRSTATKIVLRVVVYAMDKQNNIVSYTDVHKVLSDMALIKNVTTLQIVSINKDLVTMAKAVLVLSAIIVALLIFFVKTVYMVYIRPRRFGVFITPTADFDYRQKRLETMEPGSLSEPMVTNEMERIAINVKDHKIECEQKSESGSTERSAAKGDEINQLEELPPFVPLQRASQSTPNRDSHAVSPRSDKKSPKPRKRSQPVRGDLIPDPDKLLSYKKHEGHKKNEEEMEDPTVPGGVKPREPRIPGDESAERKKSTVTFSTVVETIDS